MSRVRASSPAPAPSVVARDRTLADAEDVAIGIAEPGATRRSDRGDEVDRLRLLVLVERDAAAEQVAHDRLDVVDLEMPDGLADVRLTATHRYLAAAARPESDRERLVVQDR